MKKILLVTLSLFILAGCSKPTMEEVTSQRAEIDQMANETIATLKKDDKKVEIALDKAIGYMAVNWKVTKVPVVGAGGGNGVVVSKEDNKHVYINVSRFDIGGGVGARSYKNLVVVYDQKLLERLQKGTFDYQASAEVSAGSNVADVATNKDERYDTFILADGGGSATATLRVIRSKLSKDLN
ncbi:MAG: membrane lipoprotein lipid attachment site-containing protein [Sulfurovum sp.]|nr:membrane lipoprotein lipid attachment site-containing protein [Sulfurovaceae bacterium]